MLLPGMVLWVVAGLAAAAAVAWRPWEAVAAASWTVFGILAVVLPWVPAENGTPGPGAITVAVANVAFDNADPQGAAADIVASGADVAIVPEVTPAIDELLRRSFAHGSRRGQGISAGIGVYSDLPLGPLLEEGVFDADRYERLRVGGRHPFVLWGLHLPKPWIHAEYPQQLHPVAQAAVVDDVLDAIDREELPVVAAGDFNLTDRGRGYRRVADRLTDAMRSSWGAPTSRKLGFLPLLLRIDHVFIPDGWCSDHAHHFQLAGSDHRGVVVRVGPCR